MEQKIKKVSFKELTLIGMLTMSIGLSGCSKVNFSQVATQSASSISKTVNVSETVAYGNKKVDFLIVFDDSNSMLPDLQKLAASLGNFVTSLETSDIDWQMCMTTTSPVTISGVPTWGTTYKWVGYTPSTGTPATLLKRGTSNLDNIFINTVNSLTIGAPGSGDERAIKATYENFKNGVPGAVGSNGCYRQGAAVSVIIVSNEDERSVGGDSSKVKATDAAGSFQPLEAEDLPVKLVTKSQESFGADVRFTFNSIIVKPGDSACEAQQDASCTSPSHSAAIYSQISNMTEGGVGSICDANFTNSLNTFKDKIVNSMSHLSLQCTPDPSTLKLTINGQSFSNFSMSGSILKFNSPLIEGTKIDLSFDCL